MRARTAWLLTLPILLVGETLGHSVVARLFDPADERHALIGRASSESLEFAHVALALVLVLAAAAFASRTLSSFRAGPRPLPSWRFALAPSLAFLVQEHVEGLLTDGDAGWLTAAEPAVLVGVALQLPCGLVAVWLVRTLLRAADQLARVLAARREAADHRPQAQGWLCRPASPLRRPVLASLHAGRAPPAAA